jgi:hypothetical protein
VTNNGAVSSWTNYYDMGYTFSSNSNNCPTGCQLRCSADLGWSNRALW